MAAIKSGDVDRFVANPDPRYAVALVYGKDAGLVGERVRRLVAHAVDGSDDPFRTVRLEGDELASDPLRLAEEANTIGLFGGRRAIWVTAGAKPIGAAIDPVLKTPPEDALVIIEAGDLGKNSPLRATIERATSAVALPCYLDEARDLGHLIDEETRKAGLRIESSARSELARLLGGDRLSSRAEVNKVITYAGRETVITLKHVEAVCSDASDTVFDALVDAAFIGDREQVCALFAKLIADGNRSDALLSAALRHAVTMIRVTAEVTGGQSASDEAARRFHFKRRSVVARQLGVWTPDGAAAAASALSRTIALCRRQPRLADVQAERALLALRQFAGKPRNDA